jgi:integrase
MRGWNRLKGFTPYWNLLGGILYARGCFVKLKEFFDAVYSPLKLRGRSANTIRLYGCTISAFEKFLERPAGLEDAFDEITMARFLSKRASTRSPFTAEKERSQLMAIVRFAHSRRACGDRPLPCVPPTPLPERVPEAWSIESLQQLLKATEKSSEPVFWRAIVLVCWETAERIGAVTSITKGDIERDTVLVRAEYRKGKKRDRIYSLSEETAAAVGKLAKDKTRDQKIFEWRNRKTNLWYAFGKIVEAAGLGGGRRAKFHMLRRSAATHYAARVGFAGATELLDHSSPRVTRAYIDPRFIKTGPQPCDVLPSIFEK